MITYYPIVDRIVSCPVLKCLRTVSDKGGLPDGLVAVRDERRLGVEILADIVDVGAVVGAVVAASRSDVTAMSLRTKRHHVLVNHPAHDRGEPERNIS